MGPKVKKAKSEGGGTEVVAETADQAEWKQLKSEADRLHKVSKKEEHDFNEFQQQREKLNYFWIVEKKRLEDKRVELRNKDRELQDLEEKHQVEIKIYKQRLKHLLYEHQNEITQKKTETEKALKMAQDDDREAESDIKEDRRALSTVIKEIEITHEEYIRGLKREQDQKITMLRHEFERRSTEVQKSYEAQMKKSRDGLDKRRKEEIRAIEDRKHVMIEQLMGEHSKAFADIKNYYNDITHNNLDLIKSLKEEVKELETEEQKDKIRLQEKMQENKKLSAPLKRMQEDVIRLRAELDEYRLEKAEMRRVKAALLVVEGGQSSVAWEHETLVQRLSELRVERDELDSNLRTSVFEVKQKSAFRGMLLEKKLIALNRVQEEREAQLNEVLSRANLDPTVLGQVKGHVDDILMRKNAETRQFQQEVVRLQNLHEQLLQFTQQKLQEYGLSITELGFVPKRLGTLGGTGSSQGFQTGPALISQGY
ncbi:growth-arrest-specific micro-tubule binding-domain-containing protein [Ochromonadaceae sp. CCMP2298]|nr:growth-arrest-specific micro-tubule binding-domain-containing protein [Ochromonadaceae sp. CCMP2298]|mmetsp:Transcript_23188/g.51506  ORF Transcript_23188/g.51506 Transcript_23188/m.51506 type:complete len:482 (-) Transcript_23188:103-1548(-)